MYIPRSESGGGAEDVSTPIGTEDGGLGDTIDGRGFEDMKKAMTYKTKCMKRG